MPGKLEVSLIKERAASLRKLGTVKQSAFLDQCKNLNEMVLVEKQDIDGKCSGLTSNYISTVFYSPLKNQTNQLVPVKIKEAIDNNSTKSILHDDKTAQVSYLA